MTPEEKQQVQNLINARTKLLSEKTARQDEQIRALTEKVTELDAEIQLKDSELQSREQEISGLKSQLDEARLQLSDAQEQARKLEALIHTEPQLPAPTPQPEPPQQPIPIPEPPAQKPNYLLSLLRQHFGFDSFRPGQEQIIDALLSGQDVFCSMPDHYGRSICYRLPALLMPGITLAITPADIDRAMKDAHSASITSTLAPSKRRDILRKVKNGTCKILYATLEQLTQPDTLAALKNAEISMSVIISRWGFLPSPNATENYAPFMASLTHAQNPGHVVTGIFADTTSPELRRELFRIAGVDSPVKVVAGFGFGDADFRVLRTENKSATLRKILADKNDSPGVIYCSTPETAYRLREILHDIGSLDDRITIMPAKLSREITRNDIAFTIHYDMPDNLGDYSLQARTGSEHIMLLSRDDMKAADHSLISFIEARNQREFMLSYIGADEAGGEISHEKVAEITPDDVSDFDFDNANEAQKEAITHTEGPMLIIAGPGTGKTFTLVQRVTFMIQKKHISPGNIMLATFTEKAAREIVSRVTEELSRRGMKADTGSMYAGTFHEICGRILKEYAEFIGRRRNFRILDEYDQAYLIMRNMKKFEGARGFNIALSGSGKWANSCEIRDSVNALSEELADPEELLSASDPSVSFMGYAMKIHDQILAENNCLSYSAILVETYRILRDNPEILESLREKIKYVIVDEYQDTNHVQEQLAFMIAGDGKNICAAGDDDQSIYRFRGAEVRNILEFPGKFGYSECRIVRLMLNYRSRPGIISFFTEWMNDTEKFFSWDMFRHEKQLEAHRQEISGTHSVMRLAGINDENEWREKILHMLTALKDSGKLTDYSQVAFLFRSVKNASVQALAQYLEDNNINVYSPRSNMFFQRGEIKFALGCIISMFPAYLDALKSGEFIFNNVEPSYIGYYRSCLQTVARYITKKEYLPLKNHILGRRKFHATLQGYAGYTYSDLLYGLFGIWPFTKSLNAEMSSPEKDLRPARNLARLVEVFRKFEHSCNVNNIHGKYLRNQFQIMMNIYLRFKIEEGSDEYEDENGGTPPGHVSFMTIHQAKGMEFPIVFVDSLWSTPQPPANNDTNHQLIASISRRFCRRTEFEPQDRIKYFDFWRLYYTAFSRAQDLLILTCYENANTPSAYFEAGYNTLDDADESLNPSAIEIAPPKGAGFRNTYSFTSHILVYETCPLQYKFFCELGFMPGRSTNTFMGKLIHAVLDDIHRAVLNHEEAKINDAVISEWFSDEYAHLSRTEQAYLSKQSRETALRQVMRYVALRGGDWSDIRESEYDVNAVRGDYILEGTIDLISVRDGKTEITDFKSGPKPNINISRDRERLGNYRRQVFAYAYLVERTSGLKVDSMKIYYTGEESLSPELTFQYDPAEAEEVMKGFDETVSRIMRGDFEHKAKDIETCRDCVFRFYCGREPAGE